MKKVVLLPCLSFMFLQSNAFCDRLMDARISQLEKEINLLKKAQAKNKCMMAKKNQCIDKDISERVETLEKKQALKDKLKCFGHVKVVGLFDMSEIGEQYNRDYSYAVQLLYKGDPNAHYGNEFRAHAKETKVAFEFNDKVKILDDDVNVMAFADFDLYNGKEGTGLFTHSHQPRVRSAYVAIGGLKIGLNWSSFMDLENFPRTLDFGNCTGESLLRQPVIQYTKHMNQNFSISGAIECPDSAYIRKDGSKTYTLTLGQTGSKWATRTIPDFILGVRYKNEKINAGLRTVFTNARTFETENKTGSGDNDNKNKLFGAGIGLSAGYTFDNKNKIMAHFNYGNGMGRYLHDTADSGFFFDNDEKKLYRHRVWGALASYCHHWTKTLQSNIDFGITKIKLHDNILNQEINNAADYRAFKFFDHLTTMHVNLIWTPNSTVEIGVEYLRIQKFQAKFRNVGENGNIPHHKGLTSRLITSVKVLF